MSEPTGAQQPDAAMTLMLLQTIRLKGRATVESLPHVLDQPEHSVHVALTAASEQDFCEQRNSFVRLTDKGRAHLGELLTAERDNVDAEQLSTLYEEFCSWNVQFKEIATAWQMRDTETPNDHTDADYDHRVVNRLRELHVGVADLLDRLVELVPRLGPYRYRFGSAMERIRDGERQYVTGPLIDSYHTVWFELHEELITLLGTTRAAEAAAGRAQ